MLPSAQTKCIFPDYMTVMTVIIWYITLLVVPEPSPEVVASVNHFAFCPL
jgi:hypothetical protein